MAREGLLYAWYGDDFTGSTDVLESLASNGVQSVLFLGVEALSYRSRFPGVAAVGVAGDSRSRTPGWMDANLPAIFERLRGLGAPLTHYKVCSTFDSSPDQGSIGRAMEIGRAAFAPEFTPIVVGAPHLRRYLVFGNLFAAAGDAVYRIDRHPTMSRHPVTPMAEADLRRHLAGQTDMPVGLVDLPELQGARAEAALARELAAGAQAVLFDGVDDQTVAETGRLLWDRAMQRPLFGVGSSGLSYALLAEWRRAGVVPQPSQAPAPAPCNRLLVASGSCSLVTSAQICRAKHQGFEAIPVDPGAVDSESAMRGCVEAALETLQAGKSVVLHSALGPLERAAEPAGERLGRRLGLMLRDLIETSGVRRVLLCGGDTSSHAVQQLGAYALTWAGPMATGAPLCRVHGDGAVDGLEIVLKGGQIGPEDFFARVRAGG